MSIEKLAKTREKNIFRSIFKGSDSDSSISSCSENEEDSQNRIEEEKIDFSVSKTGITTHFSLDGLISIQIRQDSTRGIAWQVWPAATYFCLYFEQNLLLPSSPIHFLVEKSQSKKLNILELGAGTGLCGIFLAKFLQQRCPFIQLGKVVITDLSEVVPRIQENIDLNPSSLSPSSIESNALCWGRDDELESTMRLYSPSSSSSSSSPTSSDFLPSSQEDRKEESEKDNEDNYYLVIAADCVYWESLYSPLLDTLLRLMKEWRCDVIFSHVRRWKKEGKFWKALKKEGVTVNKLHEEVGEVLNENTGEKRREVTTIYRLTLSQGTS